MFSNNERFDVMLQCEVAQFLGHEAMLLDEGRFDAWFETLDDALTYEVSLRLSADRRNDEMPKDAYYLCDTKPMIRLRIDRLALDHSHVEAPPSRTVRSVSSMYILSVEEHMVHTTSALIVYRHRGQEPEPNVLHARRYDLLRMTPLGFRLVARRIVLAETVLRMPNLAIFL